MKHVMTLTAAAALAFAAGTASASISASYTGPGGVIPAMGTGGGGTWPGTFPLTPFVSSVNVLNPVKNVVSVDFANLTHSWIGDVHAVLRDPNGIGYNVVVRPGSVTGSVGWSDNFAGNYTFADGGAPIPGGGGTANNIASGTYAWGFNDAQWPSGTNGVNNSSAAGISGPAGVWTMTIYDWVGADPGNLGSWTLNVLEIPAPGTAAVLGLAGLAGLRRRR